MHSLRATTCTPLARLSAEPTRPGRRPCGGDGAGMVAGPGRARPSIAPDHRLPTSPDAQQAGRGAPQSISLDFLAREAPAAAASPAKLAPRRSKAAAAAAQPAAGAMSLHDKKPIELEQGWKFMQVGGTGQARSWAGGPQGRGRGLGPPKRPRRLGPAAPGLPAHPHLAPVTQEGITKLKKILEGDNSEVRRRRCCRCSLWRWWIAGCSCGACMLASSAICPMMATPSPAPQAFTAEHYMMLCEWRPAARRPPVAFQPGWHCAAGMGMQCRCVCRLPARGSHFSAAELQHDHRQLALLCLCPLPMPAVLRIQPTLPSAAPAPHARRHHHLQHVHTEAAL